MTKTTNIVEHDNIQERYLRLEILKLVYQNLPYTDEPATAETVIAEAKKLASWLG